MVTWGVKNTGGEKQNRSAQFLGIFSVCAPQHSVCILIAPPPPDARAIFLHNNLLCNGTWGTHNVLGAQTEKIPINK